MRKIKASSSVYSSKSSETVNVFGVPLHVQAQRTGVPMPQCMLFVMYFLREQSTHCVGMFRRPGMSLLVFTKINDGNRFQYCYV